MPLFSQRKGYKPLEKAFQRKSIDEELRNRLWSGLQIVVWDKWRARDDFYDFDDASKAVNGLLDRFWLDFFKRPLDTRPVFKPSYNGSEKTAYEILRRFFFDAKWYEVYDFVEFVLKNIPVGWAALLKKYCNVLLEKENAAYRIVDDQVVEITNETEIEAVEEALSTRLPAITAHIKRALELLSDKKSPDYRNSIKESISAVEACCEYVTGDTKATLGQALKKLKGAVAIHPALEKGFSAIYGFTNDSGGIRHALTEGDAAPSYADAKFMLVACSGFVGFLLTKASETGMKIG
uniref:HEPN AbiJ-N-terminal domain-containing protein n=1 Tax=Candidatus Kentrum eta TaxID=2126337 RepID=A0A450UD18_9GAMM|nr:MAG: hypothetical protein BECKH772A_GA0070896_1002015 [Candidatus Kentron sp. H]VFJ92414.1 MAG: hypothetical protein BECKH772B_GA0070898_1002915 [Candidatus Kentron sp. H]VFJ99015.1 MAG: hypothetical protein BECKH772C_GA0070978_1002814 [Candidatus Kentron sp. H]